MKKSVVVTVVISAIIGCAVGFLTGNLSREMKMPGEALRTEDATGRWIRHTENLVDVDAEILTNTRIRLVMQAIPTYALLHAGHLPESLDVLVADDLLGKEVIRDGWGRLLIYTFDDAASQYTVRSLGADGETSEDDIPRE